MNQQITIDKVDNGYIVRESGYSFSGQPLNYNGMPITLVFTKLEDALAHMKKKLGDK